jgi:hypothetical protein
VKRSLALATATAIASVCLPAVPAHATVGNVCHLGGDPNIPWFAPKTTVDVWWTTNPSLNPLFALPLGQTQFHNALSKAIAIWNEEGGTSLKLRNRGPTPATSVDNAVVITGHPTSCTNAIAVAFPALTAGKKYLRGTIELRRVAGGTCAPVNWVTSLTGGTDLVAVLVHEFGHQVYNIAHPQDCPGDFGQKSVMRTASRVLKNWDLEVAQARYGHRAQYARFHKSKMIGPASWSPGIPATGMEFLRPLYRPGSMTQRAPSPSFGWVYAFDNGVQNGGSGRLDVTRYLHGAQDWFLLSAPDGALGRPIAMAYKPASSTPAELLIAYQKPTGGTVYTSDLGQICYRRSLNNGLTWPPPEVCPTGATPNTYGMTAAWDSFSNSFLIAYTQNFNMNVLAIPATGSSMPTKVTSIGIPSPHGPGIACGASPTGSNCLLIYETSDLNAVLGWTKLNINPTTGVASKGPTFSQGFFVYDTPSVIYIPAGDTFRLAITQGNSAIYSFSMPATSGTTWTGTGDVYNNQGAHISTGVLAARLAFNGTDVSPYGWFIKYW